MRIRRATPDDYDAVGELTVAAYSSIDGGVLDHAYAAELRDVAGRAETTEILVAEDGGRVIGAVAYVGAGGPYAEWGDDDSLAGFRMLAVAPEARHRGAGAALIAACIDRGRAQGKRMLVIHSQPWMTSAHRLYERFGFRRDESRDIPHWHLLGYVLPLALCT